MGTWDGSVSRRVALFQQQTPSPLPGPTRAIWTLHTRERRQAARQGEANGAPRWALLGLPPPPIQPLPNCVAWSALLSPLGLCHSPHDGRHLGKFRYVSRDRAGPRCHRSNRVVVRPGTWMRLIHCCPSCPHSLLRGLRLGQNRSSSVTPERGPGLLVIHFWFLLSYPLQELCVL